MIKSNNSAKFSVEDYQFQSFTDVPEDHAEVKTFEFQNFFNREELLKRADHQKTIKLERTVSEKTGFKVNPIVEVHRGLQDQEAYEKESLIQSEVERRVSEIQDQAYRAGFEEGVRQGKEEVYEQTKQAAEEKLLDLTRMIADALSREEDLIKAQQKSVYNLIKNLTKWIVLRELKNDGQYIERLLERLLVEIQSRSNMLVQVNENDFAQMPEVLDAMKRKLGELTNVRVEVDSAIESSGIIIESENGIINATLEEQMNSIEKLFEEVGFES